MDSRSQSATAWQTSFSTVQRSFRPPSCFRCGLSLTEIACSNTAGDVPARGRRAGPCEALRRRSFELSATDGWWRKKNRKPWQIFGDFHMRNSGKPFKSLLAGLFRGLGDGRAWYPTVLKEFRRRKGATCALELKMHNHRRSVL